jgi:hypothetical protein
MENQNKKNPLVITGIKTFERNPKAPDFVVCDGVLTPKLLIEQIKELGQNLDDAKQEYNGNVQFKFQILKNDYGSFTFKFNNFKPQKAQNKDQTTEPILNVNDENDLPF